MNHRWKKAQKKELLHHSFESFEHGRSIFEKSYSQYFSWLGIDRNQNNKLILEIGPAMFPAVTYCFNYRAIIIEPMETEFLRMNISGEPVRLIKQPAEKVDIPEVDETWLFNVLCHVYDPDLIINKVKERSKVVRFFEPINTVTDVCHLYSFTLEFFEKYFPGCVNHYLPPEGVECFHAHEACYGVWFK